MSLLFCKCKLKVDAIKNFFDDSGTESSETTKNFWMGLQSGTEVLVTISEKQLSTNETISNAGERCYEMLEDGEVSGWLLCQNVFSEAWEGNSETVFFEMSEVS